jgi:hypothetical protein
MSNSMGIGHGDQSPPRGPRRPEAIQRWHKQAARAAVVAGAITVLAAVVVYTATGQVSSRHEEVAPSSAAPSPIDEVPSPAPPERGVACPSLAAAARYLAEDNRDLFRKVADTAGRVAAQSLQKSSQLFGLAEKAALRLRLAVKRFAPTAPTVQAILARAEQVCSRLGRWPRGEL